MDTDLFRDSLKLGVDPVDVMKVYRSVVTGLIDKIREKLRDIWDAGHGAIPMVGTIFAVLAAPVYAVCALT